MDKEKVKALRSWWASEYGKSVLDNEIYILLDEAINELEKGRG